MRCLSPEGEDSGRERGGDGKGARPLLEGEETEPSIIKTNGVINADGQTNQPPPPAYNMNYVAAVPWVVKY